MESKKPLRKIKVSQLTLGMHVVGLDISWIDSPFLTHSKKIKTNKEILKLKEAGAKVITIDPNRGKDIADEKPKEDIVEDKTQEPEATEPEAPDGDSSKQNSPPEKQRVSLDKELSVARELKGKLTKAVKSLQDDIAANKAISTEQVTPLIDQTLESLERNDQALMSLAHISRRSQKLVDHTFNTFCFALNLAQCKKVSDEEKECLGIAALLHETGWNNIPLQLMGKRKGYSAVEKKLIHKHPELALKSLASSNLPDLVRRIIVEHHERCDGSGYPKNLKSEEIHPLSKILAVADTYDELIHQLRDKPGMLPTNALRLLYVDGDKGIFEKTDITALIALIGIYPVSSAVLLNTGEKGIVKEVPSDKHMQPVVEIFYGKNGTALSQPKIIDLAAESTEDHKLEISTVLNANSAEHDPKRLLVLNI